MPIFGLVHISTSDGINVDILHFLTEHSLALDAFRLATLLPELVFAIGLMRQFMEGQLPENDLITLLRIMINALPGCERFEICSFFGEVLRRCNKMDMVLHQYISVKDKTFLSL